MEGGTGEAPLPSSWARFPTVCASVYLSVTGAHQAQLEVLKLLNELSMGCAPSELPELGAWTMGRMVHAAPLTFVGSPQ